MTQIVKEQRGSMVALFVKVGQDARHLCVIHLHSTVVELSRMFRVPNPSEYLDSLE